MERREFLGVAVGLLFCGRWELGDEYELRWARSPVGIRVSVGRIRSVYWLETGERWRRERCEGGWETWGSDRSGVKLRYTALREGGAVDVLHIWEFDSPCVAVENFRRRQRAEDAAFGGKPQFCDQPGEPPYEMDGTVVLE